MDKFFLIVEVLGYLFALYLFFKKKELAIIYIPVLVFINNFIEPAFSAFIYYSTISFLILNSIAKNQSFYKKNIFAVLLFLYFLVLLTRSTDLVAIRSNAFAVFWLLASIPLISAIYQKYPEEEIFHEVSNAAFIILCLFIANVLMSTVNHYAPTGMYGISSGILYGNLYAAGFNILAVALFLTVLKLLMTRKPIYFLVVIVSYFFIMLSLRRTVMLVSTLGIVIPMLTLLAGREMKKFILVGSLIALVGYMVYTDTDFMNQFNERYEQRHLDTRELGSESRFLEYRLLYNDMFVYNAYSPWIGYELLNSAGNYGNGIFGLRTLHGDLPSIIHSGGIIALILYLLMVIKAFRSSLKATATVADKFVVLFCAIAFTVFTITGRFTECGAMILLYLTLQLPLSVKEDEIETVPVAEKEKPLQQFAWLNN
jgi:hypothetical protein